MATVNKDLEISKTDDADVRIRQQREEERNKRRMLSDAQIWSLELQG
jgi:hypothetical protein